jgi:hypothetical protein
LFHQPKQDSSWDTGFLGQSSCGGPVMSKGSRLNSSERGSRDIFILWPSYSQPEACLPTASIIFLCSPEIACCSFPVSGNLRTCSFSGRLIVNRKPFSRLQATSFCVVPRLPAARVPAPTNYSKYDPPSGERQILLARCHIARQ